MDEKTIQFIIKLFSIAGFIIVLGIPTLFGYLVIKDGNSDIVTIAFNDLVGLGQAVFYIIGSIILGKPIATGLFQFLNSKANQTNSVAASIPPATVPDPTVTTTPSAI